MPSKTQSVIDPSKARAGHPFHMFDAITAQPTAIADAVARNREGVAKLARALKQTPSLTLAGLGTSLNGAIYGEYWLRTIGRMASVRAVSSFDVVNYGLKPAAGGALLVLSHRGWKQYSARAVAEAKAAGVVTAAICGQGPDEGARLADHLLLTTEQEQSAAHTKSLTAAMALLFESALELRAQGDGADSETQRLRTEFAAIPDLMRRRLGDDSRERDAAEQLRNYRRIVVLGGGPNYPTAREIALKLKETSFVYAEGMQVEEFLHGPISAADRDTLVILASGGGAAGARAAQVANALGEIGAERLGIHTRAGSALAEAVDVGIQVEGEDEALSPFALLLSLQLFTYWLAVKRGCNPDLAHRDDAHHVKAATHFEM
ncbi:MAG TPA: SIS domain-containing protein [Candidatus Binataceae bacterium]|nr:SIS domain-containing protein [Candidatus Binataceae bacterium]